MQAQAGFDSIFIPVDNTKGTEIGKVRKFLSKVIRKLCRRPVEVPTLWALFHFILRWRYEEQHVCHLDDCTELAVKCGIQQEHVGDVLEYIHHNLGTILYYNIPVLSHLVICNPEVLFKCISKLISRVYETTGDDMYKHGEIPSSTFEELLNDTIQESKVSSLMNVKYVTDLLMHFKIVTLMEPEESQVCQLEFCGKDTSQSSSVYFMPSLLRPNAKTAPQPSPEDIKKHPLVVCFPGKIVPVGLVTALIVQLRSMPNWSLPLAQRYSNHFKFRIKGGDFLVELKVRHSQLEVVCWSEKEGRPVPHDIRCSIYQDIKAAISNVIKLLEYTTSCRPFYLLYCPVGHFAEYKEEDSKKHIYCTKCPDRIVAAREQLEWFTKVQFELSII